MQNLTGNNRIPDLSVSKLPEPSPDQICSHKCCNWLSVTAPRPALTCIWLFDKSNSCMFVLYLSNEASWTASDELKLLSPKRSSRIELFDFSAMTEINKTNNIIYNFSLHYIGAQVQSSKSLISQYNACFLFVYNLPYDS